MLYSLPHDADDDGDGIPNYWEEQYGLRSDLADDGSGDADGDGYTNIEEYLNNTDPAPGGGQLVAIGATDSRIVEGETSPHAMTLFRFGDASTSLTVDYAVSGGAAPGDDYAPLKGSAHFPEGAASASISLTARADDLAEEPEQVVVSLSASSHYRLGLPRAALVVIEDD